ncbi:MAG: hypothetical protein WDM90_01395 [Ferruginibacter sp.]
MEDDKEQLWFSTELTAFSFDKKTDFFRDYNFAQKDTISFELGIDPVVQKNDVMWFANSSYGMIEYNTKTKERTISIF